jgi:hypothetical protein
LNKTSSFSVQLLVLYITLICSVYPIADFNYYSIWKLIHFMNGLCESYDGLSWGSVWTISQWLNVAKCFKHIIERGSEELILIKIAAKLIASRINSRGVGFIVINLLEI